MVVQACNFSTPRRLRQAGGLPQVQGWPGMHSEFKSGLIHTVGPCLKKGRFLTIFLWTGKGFLLVVTFENGTFL